MFETIHNKVAFYCDSNFYSFCFIFIRFLVECLNESNGKKQQFVCVLWLMKIFTTLSHFSQFNAFPTILAIVVNRADISPVISSIIHFNTANQFRILNRGKLIHTHIYFPTKSNVLRAD